MRRCHQKFSRIASCIRRGGRVSETAIGRRLKPIIVMTASFVLTLALAQTVSSAPAPPAAREVAPDTYLLPGAMLLERGPDGNTVIVVAPEGLIVIDTGRHPWHSDGILAFARTRRLGVAAIVNTHWHLDHSSGNKRVKAAHPAAKVYATRAVDRLAQILSSHSRSGP